MAAILKDGEFRARLPRRLHSELGIQLESWVERAADCYVQKDLDRLSYPVADELARSYQMTKLHHLDSFLVVW